MQTISINPGIDRVREATSPNINQHIDNKMLERVEKMRYQDRYAIRQRITALEKEWDVERTLELNASLLSLGGLLLALTSSRKWLALPIVVTSFLAQHAIQGWCPPLPILRKLGVRTQKEIEAERHALMEILHTT